LHDGSKSEPLSAIALAFLEEEKQQQILKNKLASEAAKQDTKRKRG
jgi:hypothetical protein